MDRTRAATGDRDGRRGTKPAADGRPAVSLDDAKPFGYYREIRRLHVPGLVLGIQRLQPDLFVPPLVFAGRNVRAGVLLDGVTRGLIQHAEALDQQDLVLPRAGGMEAEQVEAAIGDAWLHGLAQIGRAHV